MIYLLLFAIVIVLACGLVLIVKYALDFSAKYIELTEDEKEDSKPENIEAKTEVLCEVTVTEDVLNKSDEFLEKTEELERRHAWADFYEQRAEDLWREAVEKECRGYSEISVNDARRDSRTLKGKSVRIRNGDMSTPNGHPPKVDKFGTFKWGTESDGPK